MKKTELGKAELGAPKGPAAAGETGVTLSGSRS